MSAPDNLKMPNWFIWIMGGILAAGGAAFIKMYDANISHELRIESLERSKAADREEMKTLISAVNANSNRITKVEESNGEFQTKSIDKLNELLKRDRFRPR